MKKIIKTHINNLSSEDFEKRQSSINFLINSKDEKDENTLKKILKLLESENATERNSSMEILIGFGEYSINNVIEITKTDKSNQRIYSSNILGEIRSEKAINSLLSLLEDEESNVRFAAAEAIGKIGSKEATLPLLHYLHSRQDDPWEQFPLILTLGEIKDERSVIPLLRLIDNDMLKQPILQAISTIADENALSYIFDLIKTSDDESIESMCILVIKNIKDKVNKYKSGIESLEIIIKENFDNLDSSQIDKIIKLLDKEINNDDFSIKLGSIFLLGYLSNSRSIDILLNNYNTDLDIEIEQSIENIAKKDYKIVLKSLLSKGINKQDILTRVLGKLRIVEIKDVFIDKLSHENPNVKIQSIKALAKISDDRDLTYIFKMLLDENEEVKNCTIESLKKFNSNKVLDLLDNFDTDEYTKIKIISNLKVNIKDILKFAQSKNFKVRKIVADNIKNYPPNIAKKELFTLLHDENILVSESAIRTIEYRKENIESLYDFLINSNSDWIRYYFAKLLVYQNINNKSIEYLKKLLNDEVPFVRISAIETLGKIEDGLSNLDRCEKISKDFLNKLIELSDNDDSDISKSAIIALSSFNYDADKFYSILENKFNNNDWIIRKSVAYVLGIIDDSKIAYKIMLEMITKENEKIVLKEIVKSLSHIYTKADFKDQILYRLLKFTVDDDLRDFTIETISLMDKSIVTKLQNIFEISSDELKMNIISIVSKINDEKALQFLIKLSSYDSLSKIRKHAILSLNNFKDQQRALWAIMWAANHDTDLYVSQTAKSLLVS